MRSILARPERLAAAIALLTVACSSELPAPIPSAQSEEPRRGGVVKLATFSDVRSLDPANMADGLAPQILEQLFAGLVDYDDDGELVPDIAERWVVEDGGATVRFYLREGVRFHDGDEVTAEDVKRSVERALHGSAPNPYASYYSSITGFSEWNAERAEGLAGVAVEGRYVVSFRLKEPDATFLPLMAMPMLRPVCKSAGARYSDTWHPCGAGPFTLPEKGWQRGHSLAVTRHEGYYRRGLPYLDGVRWTFHDSPSSQAFKFARGELDVLRDFLAPELLKFQADARWSPYGEFEADKQVLGEAMNVEVPPFDNVEIRRAVAAGIDRESLRKVRAAHLRATGQLVPPGVFGHDPAFEGQRYDYEAALEHMRRAGYPYDPVTKTGGWPEVVPYLVYKQGLQEYMGQVLAQQLARIGIRIEIRVVNYPTFLSLRGRRYASPFGPGMWAQDFPDALSFLEPLFHSKAISEESSNNWSFYQNPRFDELVDRARRELDDERRKGLYTEAQSILVEDAPWAFSQTYRFYTQRQPYLQGHRTHPMWMHSLTRAWLDRASGPGAARVVFGRRSLAALFGGGGGP